MEKKNRIKDETIKKFVTAYLSNSLNATQAYHFCHPNASLSTCRSGGHKLLNNERVVEELNRIRGEVSNFNITKDDIIQSNLEIRKLAIKEKKYSDALKANELITKLMGFNEAEKIQQTGTITFDFGNILDEIIDDYEESPQPPIPLNE